MLHYFCLSSFPTLVTRPLHSESRFDAPPDGLIASMRTRIVQLTVNDVKEQCPPLITLSMLLTKIIRLIQQPALKVKEQLVIWRMYSYMAPKQHVNKDYMYNVFATISHAR